MIERDRRTINITEYFILYGLCKLCIFLDTKFSKCRYRAEQNLLGGTPRRVRGGADAPPRHRFPSFRVSSKSSGPVCIFVMHLLFFITSSLMFTNILTFKHDRVDTEFSYLFCQKIIYHQRLSQCK